MSGYQWRANQTPQPIPSGIRGIRLLTKAEYDAMPNRAKEARRAHWAGIIRGLQFEHDRMYHSHADALDEAIRESRGAA